MFMYFQRSCFSVSSYDHCGSTAHAKLIADDESPVQKYHRPSFIQRCLLPSSSSFSCITTSDPINTSLPKYPASSSGDI